MARPASRERTTCGSCELPFYAERGECPYCAGQGDGSDEDGGFVFGSGGSSGRPRVECPECRLSHYEDAEACPYCTYAGASDETAYPEHDEESAEAVETVEPPQAESAGDDGGGLFGRLKRALGF